MVHAVIEDGYISQQEGDKQHYRVHHIHAERAKAAQRVRKEVRGCRHVASEAERVASDVSTTLNLCSIVSVNGGDGALPAPPPVCTPHH